MHGMTAWGGRLGPRAGGPNRPECILVSMERLQAEWGGGLTLPGSSRWVRDESSLFPCNGIFRPAFLTAVSLMCIFHTYVSTMGGWRLS